MRNGHLEKKLNIVRYIFAILYLVIAFIVVNAFGKQGLVIWGFLYYIIIGTFLLALFYKFKMLKYIWYKASGFIFFIIIVIISLLISFLIHNYFSGKTPLTEGETLSFYGDYITFIGTFGLGYFIYKKGESHRIEEKIINCKKLSSCIDFAYTEMMKIVQNNVQLNKIFYEEKWKDYYYEFESLINKNGCNIKRTLEYFFSVIDNMNSALAVNDYAKAVTVYKDYIEEEFYSTKDYNFSEAQKIIHNVAYFREFQINMSSWNEKPAINKIVNKYSKAYFYIVRNWIYNYLLKNNLEQVEAERIERHIVDWLLENEEFKKLAKTPAEKRIITQIVLEISSQIAIDQPILASLLIKDKL